MGFFSDNKKKQSKEEIIQRVIKNKGGKYYLCYYVNLTSEELDIFYEKGWELITTNSIYAGDYIYHFKRREVN